jgi:pantoate--beta-alanine ligase
MQRVESVRDLQALADAERAAGLRIALVPTMGALHPGHLSLVEAARRRADRVWVSIFVNPTQFDDPSDLDRYPRTLPDDLEACRAAQVDLVFVPTAAQMYPEGAQTRVEVLELSKPLCGRTRPGHFRGVTTVVAKLLLAAKPHVAVFGEKDFQQLAVIAQALLGLVRAEIGKAPRAEIDYAELRCPESLASAPDRLEGAALLALAVFLRPAAGCEGAGVRLIDNRVLRP